MEKESFTGLTCPALRTPGVAKACVWSGVLYILNRHQPKSNCTYFRHLLQPPIHSQFPTLNKTSQGVPSYALSPIPCSSRGPSSIDQIMTLRRFSSWPFVALRGQKRCSPPPFEDRPNYALQWCSPWPFVDNKGVLPRPSRIDQIMPCNGVLRGPPWQRCSPPPFVALRGQ